MLQLIFQVIKVMIVAAAAAVTATHFLLTPMPELSKYLVLIAVLLILLTAMYNYASGRFKQD